MLPFASFRTVLDPLGSTDTNVGKKLEPLSSDSIQTLIGSAIWPQRTISMMNKQKTVQQTDLKVSPSLSTKYIQPNSSMKMRSPDLNHMSPGCSTSRTIFFSVASLST